MVQVTSRNSGGPFGVRELLLDVFKSAQDLYRDDGPQWAAAVAYYALVSIFPLLLAAIAIATYFVDQNWAVNQMTRLLGSYLPQGSRQVTEIVQEVIKARGGVSILSILFLLWSGSRVFSALIKAINTAFDVKKDYSFLKRSAIELAMTLTIGLLSIIALASRSLVLFLGTKLSWFPTGLEIFMNLVLQLLTGLLLFTVFYLLYRYAPRTRVNPRAAIYGAAFSAALFVIARPLFLLYLSQITDFNLIYGSLAILVSLAIWAWLVALIILLGGEITARLQQSRFGPLRKES